MVRSYSDYITSKSGALLLTETTPLFDVHAFVGRQLCIYRCTGHCEGLFINGVSIVEVDGSPSRPCFILVENALILLGLLQEN